MALVVPNTGEAAALSILIGKTVQPSLAIRLFTNNLVPDESTSIGSMNECTTAGYPTNGITLTGSSWTVATDGGTGVTTASYGSQTFTLTAAASIYGYYVTDSGASPTTVFWVERFSGAPFTLPSGGGTISVTPKISLD